LGDDGLGFKQIRPILFHGILVGIASVGILLVILSLVDYMDIVSLIFYCLIMIIPLLLAVPPFRLILTGFGELVKAFYWAFLIPSLAYFLQAHDFHRIIPLISLPLFLIALAFLIIEEFPTFASDQRQNRKTLLIRLSWRISISVHHGLILGAYLNLSLLPLFGLSWNVMWPVFLSFPFAVMQMIWLQRISGGAKPFWRVFIPYASSLVALAVYSLSMAFWIN
jgi:1,4-dihydroxy-2-naphthoate octaprenyltransferase